MEMMFIFGTSFSEIALHYLHLGFRFGVYVYFCYLTLAHKTSVMRISLIQNTDFMR